MSKSIAQRLLSAPAYVRWRRIKDALSRVVLYQLLRRLMPRGHRLLGLRHMPFKMYLDLRESPMMMRRWLGAYEPHKTAFMQREVRPGMTVIDIGVNKGYFTLLAASLVGRQGRVLSFEPSPDNCHWIRKSIEANGLQNVRLFEMALSNAEGRTQLRLGVTSGGHSITDSSHRRGGGEVTVNTDTLDNVLAANGIDDADLIKMDVEGAEMLVIEGAAGLLRRASRLKLAVDIHPQHGVDPEAVIEALEGLGFEVTTMAGQPLNPEQRQSVHEILATKP